MRRPEKHVVMETPAQAAEKHNRVLLHALQTAHPVMYQDKQHFLHSLTFMTYAGGLKTYVYLAGQTLSVPADQVQLREVKQ